MAKKPDYFDISLPIYEGMITYPGNPEVEIESLKTKTSFISKITFGSHTGTHIDAPRHVFGNGKGVDQISLEALIGPCRVIDLARVEIRITPEDLEKHQIKKGERILVRTRNSQRGFKKFYDDYVHLDSDAAEFLARCGIQLFGIDSLSVKKRGSLDNRPHTALLKKNIPILEGIDLSKVQAGGYSLVALPLKLKKGDGAPARAILIQS